MRLGLKERLKIKGEKKKKKKKKKKKILGKVTWVIQVVLVNPQ